MTWFAHNWILIIDWKLYSIFLRFAINMEQSLQWYDWLYRRWKLFIWLKFRQVFICYKWLLVSNWNFWSCFDLICRRWCCYFWCCHFWWFCCFCSYSLTFLAWPSCSEVYLSWWKLFFILTEELSGTTTIVFVMVLLSSSC